MARAKSSLPVPESPKMSAVASERATWGRMAKIFSSAGLLPTMSSKVCERSTSRRRRWISDRSRKDSTPPMSLPSASCSGAAEMDTGTVSPSVRTMKMDLPPMEGAPPMQARRAHCPSHRLEWNTSQHFWPKASSTGTPVMWLAAWLNEVMFQSRSTVNTPSAMFSRMVSQGMRGGIAMYGVLV